MIMAGWWKLVMRTYQSLGIGVELGTILALLLVKALRHRPTKTPALTASSQRSQTAVTDAKVLLAPPGVMKRTQALIQLPRTLIPTPSRLASRIVRKTLAIVRILRMTVIRARVSKASPIPRVVAQQLKATAQTRTLGRLIESIRKGSTASFMKRIIPEMKMASSCQRTETKEHPPSSPTEIQRVKDRTPRAIALKVKARTPRATTRRTVTNLQTKISMTAGRENTTKKTIRETRTGSSWQKMRVKRPAQVITANQTRIPAAKLPTMTMTGGRMILTRKSKPETSSTSSRRKTRRIKRPQVVTAVVRTVRKARNNTLCKI